MRTADSRLGEEGGGAGHPGSCWDPPPLAFPSRNVGLHFRSVAALVKLGAFCRSCPSLLGFLCIQFTATAGGRAGDIVTRRPGFPAVRVAGEVLQGLGTGRLCHSGACSRAVTCEP